MHKIGFIDIVGLRACQHVSLPVEPFTPLVGQNNAGKSTILFALAWVLKPSALAESDFSKIDEPVVVTARIDGITNEVLDLIPEPKHRAAIAPYCASGSIWIRVVASTPGSKGLAREVFDIENYQGNAIPSTWRAYPTGLPQAVSALLPDALCIDAMEDLGEDLGKAKTGSTMKSLLDLIMGPIVEAHAELAAAIQTVQSILSYVLDFAASMGLSVLVHPMQLCRPGFGSYYLQNLIGNTVETGAAIASVLLSGIFERIPALRLAFVHGAGVAPGLLGRWDHGFKQRKDVSRDTKEEPSATFRKHIYADLLTHSAYARKLLIDVAGRERLLLGSDYPFDMGDQDPIGSATRSGLDLSLLRNNALSWLGCNCHSNLHGAIYPADSKEPIG